MAKSKTGKSANKNAENIENELVDEELEEGLEAADEGEANEDFIDFDLDDNWAPATGDVTGYWDPEKSACMAIPLGVKLFDGNIEEHKPAMLILMKMTRAFPLKTKTPGGEWEYLKGKPGDVVGVWYKPGMRGVLNRGGVEVYIKLTEETLDTGKPNEMKLFDVRAQSIGERISVLEDERDKSAHVKTPFDRRKRQPQSDADESFV